MTATGMIAAAVVTPVWAASPAAAASLCAPKPDTVPPQVTSVAFSSPTIDLSTGPRTETVTADVIDTSGNGAPSGVKSVTVFVEGKGGGADANLSLASGTAANGVWSGTLTIPKRAHAGTWLLRQVDVVDADGNEQFYGEYGTHPQSPQDIRLQTGWETSITVTGSGPPPPKKTKAGKLSDFSFKPLAVNSTAAARWVHVTASFSAPLPSHVNVDFNKSSGKGRGFYRGVSLTKSGDGVWVGKIKVPRWVGDGKARPRVFANYPAKDTPRFRAISAATLHARHFPSVLTYTSGVDKTKPALTSLTFSPTTVDTTSGAQLVTVTATATDALSGVKSVHAELSISHGAGGSAAGLYPFPGIGYVDRGFVNVTLAQVGDQWVGTAKFRRCVPSGTWHVSASVQDRADNYSFYSSKTLIRDEMPGTLSVTSTPGDVEDPYVRDATASGLDHTITMDFSEGVKNVNTTTLSVYAMKPAASRFDTTATVSGISCSNGSAIVDCSGSGGLITSAILTVPALVGGAKYEVYGNLGEVTPQLTDGAGNPLEWNGYAAEVTGS